MVYIASWDDFVEKSVQLFSSDPEKVKFSSTVIVTVLWLYCNIVITSVLCASRLLWFHWVAQTRYSMKYRHCDGKLVLKVTDDKEVDCCMRFPLCNSEFNLYYNVMFLVRWNHAVSVLFAFWLIWAAVDCYPVVFFYYVAIYYDRTNMSMISFNCLKIVGFWPVMSLQH